jgi:hypothetical protein
MRFAEIVDKAGKRIHMGVIMAAAQEWIEVSLPETMNVGADSEVRFPPSLLAHHVAVRWRKADRVGLAYLAGGPSEEQFAGLSGLNDMRSLSHMMNSLAFKGA